MNLFTLQLKASLSLETLRKQRNEAGEDLLRAGDYVQQAEWVLAEARNRATLARQEWLDLSRQVHEIEKKAARNG